MGLGNQLSALAERTGKEFKARFQPLSFAKYSDLEAYTGDETRCLVTGYNASGAPGRRQGTFVVDSSDTTSTRLAGLIHIDGKGRRWKRASFGGVIYPEWGDADPTGVVASSALINAYIRYATLNGLKVDTSNGVWGVSADAPIDLNGGAIGAANQQWDSVLYFGGPSRAYGQCVFKALPGSWTGKAVVKGRNMSGRVVERFSVDVNGTGAKAIDLAWLGGSEGNPSLAPSNQNVVSDIFAEGGSIDLDQCHDTPLERIWARGVAQGQVALSARGPGGQMMLERSYVSSGKAVVSCQNMGLVNCGFFGGLEMADAGYNHVSTFSNHFYTDPVAKAAINSTAIGNATKGFVMIGAYINGRSLPGECIVTGRYWRGGKFIGGQAHGYESFFRDIVPAAGGGNPPVFSFENFVFKGPVPESVPGQYLVELINCERPDGTKVDRPLPFPGKLQIGADTKNGESICRTVLANDGVWNGLLFPDQPMYCGAGTVMIVGPGNDNPVLVASFARPGTNPSSGMFNVLNMLADGGGATIELRWNGGLNSPEFRVVGKTMIATVSVNYLVQA